MWQVITEYPGSGKVRATDNNFKSRAAARRTAHRVRAYLRASHSDATAVYVYPMPESNEFSDDPWQHVRADTTLTVHAKEGSK